MKYILFVLMLTAAFEVFGAAMFDAVIMSDDNCGAGDAAVCVESLYFLEMHGYPRDGHP